MSFRGGNEELVRLETGDEPRPERRSLIQDEMETSNVKMYMTVAFFAFMTIAALILAILGLKAGAAQTTVVQLNGDVQGPSDNNHLKSINPAVNSCGLDETLFNGTYLQDGLVLGGFCGNPLPNVNGNATSCPPGFYPLGDVVTANGVVENVTCVFVPVNASLINGSVQLQGTVDEIATVFDTLAGIWNISTPQPINHSSSPGFLRLYVGADNLASSANIKYYDVGLTLVGLLPVGNDTGNDTGFDNSPVFAGRVASINAFDRYQLIVVAEGDIRWLYEMQWDGQFISTSDTALPLAQSVRNGHWRLDGYSALGVNTSVGAEVPWIDIDVDAFRTFVRAEIRAPFGQLNIYENSTIAFSQMQAIVNGASDSWFSWGMEVVPPVCISTSDTDKFKWYNFGDSLYMQRLDKTPTGSLCSNNFQNVIEFMSAGARMYPNVSTQPLYSEVMIAEGQAYLVFDGYYDVPTASFYAGSGNFNVWSIGKNNNELDVLFAPVAPLFSAIELDVAARFYLANLSSAIPIEATLLVNGDVVINPGAPGSMPNLTMNVDPGVNLPRLQVVGATDFLGWNEQINFGAILQADTTFISRTIFGTGGTQISSFSDFGVLTFAKFSNGGEGSLVTPTYIGAFDVTGFRLVMSTTSPLPSTPEGVLALSSTGAGNTYVLFDSILDPVSLVPISTTNTFNPWTMYKNGNELQTLFADVTTVGSNVSFSPAIRLYPIKLAVADPTSANVRLDAGLLVYGYSQHAANITLYASPTTFMPDTQLITVDAAVNSRTELNMGVLYRRDIGDYVSTTAGGHGGQIAYFPFLQTMYFSTYPATGINQTTGAANTIATMDAVNGLTLTIPLAVNSGGLGTGVTLVGNKFAISVASPQKYVESGIGPADIPVAGTLAIPATSATTTLNVLFTRAQNQVCLTVVWTGGTAIYTTNSFTVLLSFAIPTGFKPISDTQVPVFIFDGTSDSFMWNVVVPASSTSMTFTAARTDLKGSTAFIRGSGSAGADVIGMDFAGIPAYSICYQAQ